MNKIFFNLSKFGWILEFEYSVSGQNFHRIPDIRSPDIRPDIRPDTVSGTSLVRMKFSEKIVLKVSASLNISNKIFHWYFFPFNFLWEFQNGIFSDKISDPLEGVVCFAIAPWGGVMTPFYPPMPNYDPVEALTKIIKWGSFGCIDSYFKWLFKHHNN